jgi:hypothetical protein
MWTLAEASFWTKQGLWPIAGNAQLFVEDVFSTWLYTGNGSTQTITNGIDLAGKGGLVWLKDRTTAYSHWLFDTARSPTLGLNTNNTSTPTNTGVAFQSFDSNGFTLGSASQFNASPDANVSWTFREAPNFFDVVTFTSNSSGGASFSHNLGSTPGMVIIKCTGATENWWVWHRSLATNQYMVLNLTNAVTSATPTITCTSTTVTLSSSWLVNNNTSYVAYLFAHDAGGFGPTLTDNIISCGSYTGNGSATGPVVTLGYEPQWLMVKRATGGTSNWQILDNMRGLPVGSADATLQANLSNAETSVDYVSPTATGFQVVSTSSEVNTNTSTYIYVAIRRGPMRTPTLGTSVFNPVVRTGTGAAATVNSGNLPDWIIMKMSSGSGSSGNAYTRLTGNNRQLYTDLDLPLIDQSAPYGVTGFLNTSYTLGLNANNENLSGASIANWVFSRAPGFMDVVCYTGSNSDITIPHNLAAKPELIIVKSRSNTRDWAVILPSIVTGSSSGTDFSTGVLNRTNALIRRNYGGNAWLTQDVTSTNLFFEGDSAGGNAEINFGGWTYVAYLFASVAGVSKVGSYTGNGSSQTINCAFTTGARYVLIKRTDSTGDWYVWDSARGIVAGNDPYLALNTSAAEVASNDSVDTDSTGFIVNQVAASNVNVNAATYIFLAIA